MDQETGAFIDVILFKLTCKLVWSIRVKYNIVQMRKRNLHKNKNSWLGLSNAYVTRKPYLG